MKGGRADDENRRGTERPSGTLGEWLRSLVVALVLFLLIRGFLLKTFVIISGSMEPTLLVGDMLMINRAAMGSEIPLLHVRIPGYSSPYRGEIMVFRPPPLDSTADADLVKRIVGTPGDTLRMRDRVLYVNGQAQTESYVRHEDSPNEGYPWMKWQKDYLAPGVDPKTYAPTRDDWGPIVVPAGHYFMMGDNREESLDSRYWGFVPRNSLEGRPFFIYFSYNRGSYRPFPWLLEIRWSRLGTIPSGRS